MKLIDKIRSWWRGPDVDPAALAEARKIRDDMARQRNDVMTGGPNVSHRAGKDDVGRGDW